MSLTTYPSYKLSRGSLPRRPHCGPEAAPSAAKGLPEAFPALASGKVPMSAGLARLALFDVPHLRPRTAAPSLDTQAGAWVLTRPVLTPVPSEDLDPTFINTRWALETNTTRRSDHNSRYLVSWSPLLAPLTSPVGSVNMALAGPGPRQSVPTGALRASLLALNELGLKNIRGAHKALLAQGAGSCAVVTTAAHGAAAPLLQWAQLWAAAPFPSTQPQVLASGHPRPAFWVGQGAHLEGLRSRLFQGGGALPLAPTPSTGDRNATLAGVIAALEFSRLGEEGLGHQPRQGYLPLSSDIGASRRLRVTKGVTLPSDTPIEIICGSKDVIHS